MHAQEPPSHAAVLPSANVTGGLEHAAASESSSVSEKGNEDTEGRDMAQQAPESRKILQVRQVRDGHDSRLVDRPTRELGRRRDAPFRFRARPGGVTTPISLAARAVEASRCLCGTSVQRRRHRGACFATTPSRGGVAMPRNDPRLAREAPRTPRGRHARPSEARGRLADDTRDRRRHADASAGPSSRDRGSATPGEPPGPRARARSIPLRRCAEQARVPVGPGR